MIGVMVGACGGSGDLSPLCDKAQECAEKSSTPFSKTECVENAKKAREKADSVKCGDEYGDVASCVNGIDFACSDDLDKKINAECGAEIKKYEKCL